MADFYQHKKTLEDFLQSVNFIYSGDVLSSSEITLTENLKHSSFSAVLFRKVMIEIYKKSISSMMIKSKEIIIHRNSFDDIYDFFKKLPFKTEILFYSNNSNLNLNLGSSVLELDNDGHGYLPNYFTRRFKMMSQNTDVSAYYCPIIDDSEDDCHFYVVNKPIQSMVWALQNMTYSINKSNSLNEHIINIPIYDCDFVSYKVRVVNTEKLRNDKINSILNDN